MNSVRSEVRNALSGFNIDIDADKFFSFVDVIRIGFEFGTKYWAELASNWFDELAEEKKVELKDSLSGILTAKWSTQKLRQKAQKELTYCGVFPPK